MDMMKDLYQSVSIINNRVMTIWRE
jgi:hypothetical protein